LPAGANRGITVRRYRPGHHEEITLKYLDQARHSRLMQQVRGRSLRARMIRGVSGTFVVRGVNAVLLFIINLLLARALGANGLGAFNYAATWIMLLIVPAVFGMDRLLIRELSVLRTRREWGQMRGLLTYAIRAALITAVLLAVIVALLAWLTYALTGRPALLKAEGLARPALYTLWIALAMMPVWTVLQAQSAAMQGLRHVVISQIPEQIAAPGIFVVLALAAYLAGVLKSAQWMMILQALGMVAALVYSRYMLNRKIPHDARAAAPVYAPRQWLVGAIPLTLNRGLIVLNSQFDIVLLGAITGASAVGVFTVAMRGTQLITLLLVSVNTALAPSLAQLHAEGDRQRTEQLVTQSALLMTGLALPMALFFLVGGRWFLGWFGAEFRDGYATLLILTIGQLFNVATGSVNILLIMTNRDRIAMLSAGVGLILHVLCGVLLIPRWGAEGAAAARSLSIVALNVLMVGVAWRQLGVDTTFWSALRYWFRRARQKK
jgi:O-antigen/teichoic acid export membrane protein